MPLMSLLPLTAVSSKNTAVNKPEVAFDVLMWNLELREAIAIHLRLQLGKPDLELEAVEPLPVSRLRMIWKGDTALMTGVSLNLAWISNSQRPNTVGFQLFCT